MHFAQQEQQNQGAPVYDVENELKLRARRAGLTTRELAGILNEPPGTTCGRLNGFLPLSFSQRKKLIVGIEKAESERAVRKPETK